MVHPYLHMLRTLKLSYRSVESFLEHFREHLLLLLNVTPQFSPGPVDFLFQ